MKKVRIAVGKEQVAFAFFYRQRRQQGAVRSGSEHDALTVQYGSFRQSQYAVARGDGWRTLQQGCPERYSPIEKPIACGRRIDDTVVWHEEPAHQSWPEFGLFHRELRFVEDIGTDSGSGIDRSFCAYFGHLFFVGCDPERAA